MATYGEKYRYEWVEPAALYVVEIQELDHTAGAVTLTPSDRPLEITGATQEAEKVYRPFRPQTATLRFLGGANNPREVFDAEDRQFRVQVLADSTTKDGSNLSVVWSGFIATDLYEDDPDFDKEVVELTAYDGRVLLKNEAASATSITAWEAIREPLASLGYGYDFVVNMEWRAFADPQIGTDTQPLTQYTIPAGAFRQNADPNQGRLSKYEQLRSVLAAFNLELAQVNGEWHVRQRSQLASDGTIKTWRWPSGATSFNAPTTTDYSDSLPGQLRRARPRSGLQKVQRVDATHDFGEVAELVVNGGFESQSSFWSLGPDSVILDYTNFAGVNATQDDTYGLRNDESGQDVQGQDYNTTQSGQAVVPENPSLVADFSVDVWWDRTGDVNRTPVLIGVGGSYLINERTDIRNTGTVLPADEKGTIKVNPVSGSQGTPLVPEGAKLDIYEDQGGRDVADVNVAKIELSEPFRVGDTTMQGRITDEIPNPGISYATYPEWISFSQISGFDPGDDEVFTEVGGKAFFVRPDGTPVEGPVTITLGATLDADWIFDDVSLQLTQRGRPIRSKTFTSMDTALEDAKTLTFSSKIGDGVVTSQPRRLEVANDTDNLSGDWKVGTYGSSEAASGRSLEEVRAQEIHRYRRGSLERRTAEYSAKDFGRTPFSVFVIGGTAYTVTSYRRQYGNRPRYSFELTELTDFGTSGLTQSFKIDDPAATGSSGGGGGTFIGSVEGANLPIKESDLATDAVVYEFGGFAPGPVRSGAYMFRHIAQYGYDVQQIQADAVTASTTDVEFTVSAGGSSDVITFSSSSTRETWTSALSVAAGDVLEITANEDATDLADVSFAVKLTRA